MDYSEISDQEDWGVADIGEDWDWGVADIGEDWGTEISREEDWGLERPAKKEKIRVTQKHKPPHRPPPPPPPQHRPPPPPPPESEPAPLQRRQKPMRVSGTLGETLVEEGQSAEECEQSYTRVPEPAPASFVSPPPPSWYYGGMDNFCYGGRRKSSTRPRVKSSYSSSGIQKNKLSRITRMSKGKTTKKRVARKVPKKRSTKKSSKKTGRKIVRRSYC